MLKYSKFIVAGVMAVVQFVRTYSGVDLGLDETTVSSVISAFTAILVYLVPNKV
jgi:hypothetical protein